MRYLVFDVDCFTGANQEPALDWLENSPFDFDSIFVFGKQLRELKECAALMKERFPSADIQIRRSEQQKGATEAWCAFFLGVIWSECNRHPSGQTEVFLFTTKWVVPSFVPELTNRGVHVFVPDSSKARLLDEGDSNISILKLDLPFNSASKHDKAPCGSRMPDWALRTLSAEEMRIGFEVLAVPSQELAPAPQFIPFPDAAPITIGKNAPSSIQLGMWDSSKKGLYSPHVEIEYIQMPASRWVLRSLHGHRTGSNGVAVNGRLLSAASQAVSLKNGDDLLLGGFHLRFRTDQFEELLRYEDSYQLVKDIELRLKEIADSDQIEITELIQGYDMTGVPIKSWKQVSWGQFEEILTKLWDKPGFMKIRSAIESLDDLRLLLNKVKNARNVVDHPIRGDIKLIQKKHIVELYQLLNISNVKDPS